MRSGSCASASRVAPTTSGSASSDMTIAGGEERLPVDRAVARRSGRGSRGSPARRSAARRSRARRWARRRSSRSPTRPRARATPGARTPTATRRSPRRAARRSRADRGHDQRARSIGSRKPPLWLWCSDGAGDCTKQARAQVGDALDEHEQHDRRRRSGTARCRSPSRASSRRDRPAATSGARRAGGATIAGAAGAGSTSVGAGHHARIP